MAEDTFKGRQATQLPPSPPRFYGTWEIDLPALRDWLQEFYIFMTATSGLADPLYQQTIGEISFQKLPDPVQTTVARAQFTANRAWEVAEQYNIDWDAKLRKFVFGGSFTISGTSDEGNPIFDFDLGTTDYFVSCVATGSTGSPSVDALRVVEITKGTGGIAVNVTAAPGVGKSVSFDYIVVGKLPALPPTEDT